MAYSSRSYSGCQPPSILYLFTCASGETLHHWKAVSHVELWTAVKWSLKAYFPIVAGTQIRQTNVLTILQFQLQQWNLPRCTPLTAMSNFKSHVPFQQLPSPPCDSSLTYTPETAKMRCMFDRSRFHCFKFFCCAPSTHSPQHFNCPGKSVRM